MANREDKHIVIVGHVDHGKSTVIGRLLADTNSLPEGKLEAVQETCRKNAKPFEYAFLLDALKDEQSQGITIDTARCFFKTAKRDYIIIDAPGHIEFLKNMITGASRASAALLVIDAHEGIKENSKRHGYMLSMLGIQDIAILVNKMDLVDYNKEVFEQVKKDYTEFLNKIGMNAKTFIPISAMKGENIASNSLKMPWYKGHHVLSLLDDFASEKTQEKSPFRMHVQDIYKFTNNNDNRRIVAGTITSGSINLSDEVVFYPSGKKSRINSIEEFNSPLLKNASAPKAIGFTLTEQIFIKRGELACLSTQTPPLISSAIVCSIFWLGKQSIKVGKKLIIKIGTTKVNATITDIIEVMDASNLQIENKQKIKRHDVAKCLIQCDRPIAFDTYDVNQLTARFVLVDDYEISGGGIILQSVSTSDSQLQEQIINRNIHWIGSHISKEERKARYGHGPILILIEGDKTSSKKEVARQLEEQLFNQGIHTYYIGMGSIKYGMDTDILNESKSDEHLRRYTEMLNILLDSGVVVISTISKLNSEAIEYINDVLSDYQVYHFTCSKKGSTLSKEINDLLKSLDMI